MQLLRGAGRRRSPPAASATARAAGTLAAALAAADPANRQELLEAALLTKANAAQPVRRRRPILAKALRARHPTLAADLDAFAVRVAAARLARIACAAFAQSRALNAFARDLARRPRRAQGGAAGCSTSTT